MHGYKQIYIGKHFGFAWRFNGNRSICCRMRSIAHGERTRVAGGVARTGIKRKSSREIEMSNGNQTGIRHKD